jgi:hypothetical protein
MWLGTGVLGPIFEGTMDEAIWLPLAMKWNDPAIFANDPVVRVLPASCRLYRVRGPCSRYGQILEWCCWSARRLLAIYVAECIGWGVSYWCRLAALLIALVSLRVNVDLSGTGWGIFLGNAMPRAFLFAATPWVLGLFIQRVQSVSQLVWVGLVVGVVGNIHPLSALHLYLMMAGALVLTAGPETRLQRLCSFSGGFAVGIIPYLFQWVQVRDVTPLRMEILKFRAEVQSFPDWDVVIQRLLSSYLPVCMIAGIGWRCIGSQEDRERAWGIVRLVLAIVIGTIIGPLLAWFVPRLFAVHLLRMSGYLFLLCLVLSGFLVRDLLRRGTWAMTVAGYAVALVLFLSAGGGRVGEVAQWATTFVSSKTTAVLGADVGPREGGEPDKQAFLDLCRWARLDTEREALFLVPPDRFASFRIYPNARSLTFKDGAVTVFSGRLAEDWYARYREANDSMKPFSFRR